MFQVVECPLPAVVTLDELPTNRTLKTVRDANGVVWVSLSSVAVAAHTYPSRLTSNLRAMSSRPTLVDRPATNPTKRTKLESLTPLAHFRSVAANHSIGGTLYPDVRGPILTALRDGVASLYDGVPLPKTEPPPHSAPKQEDEMIRFIDGKALLNRMLEVATPGSQPSDARTNRELMDGELMPVSRVAELYGEPLPVKEKTTGRQNLAVTDDAEPVTLDAVMFYGRELLGYFDGQTAWVQLASLCNGIGISVAGQWDKVVAKPWMSSRSMATTGKDGKRRVSNMMDLECVPLYLATIDERKIKPEARPMLLKFQLEAKKVLADHFFKRTPTTNGDWSDIKGIVVQLTGALSTMVNMQTATAERLDRLEGAVNRVLASA